MLCWRHTTPQANRCVLRRLCCGGWSWQSTAGISGTEAQARQSNVVFADTTTGWDDVGAPPEFPGFDLAFNLTSVPEPSTIALFGIGILGLGLARRRKKCAS